MMEMESCIPPGFRFHPTEEELVGYYLKRKINSLKIDLDVITDIDLYRMEPWDIERRCKLGYEEQKEWYFFSHKDRKYPTGTRTNRATTAGFWKATGRDKAVVSKERIIGMRKTLVFYKGRAPNGTKTDWIMHEYRLQTSENGPPQEEGWVVCRAFKKPNPSHHKQGFEAWNNANIYKTPSYPGTPNLMHNLNSTPNQVTNFRRPPFPAKSSQLLVELPKLDSPSFSTRFAIANEEVINEEEKGNFGNQLCADWKSFDKLIDSQAIGSSSSSSSSYAYPNTALVHNEIDDQNHFSCVFECFPW